MKKINKEFIEAFDKVIGHEGGYVNDKNDAGGETIYGISKRAYPNLDIKSITLDDAREIYYKDYWKKNRVEELPKDIRFTYFDMCVNMGGSRACKILQQTANAKGAGLVVDGRIGKNTIKGSKLVRLGRLKSYRVLYYARIVINKPSQEKYWYGWYRRSL